MYFKDYLNEWERLIGTDRAPLLEEMIAKHPHKTQDWLAQCLETHQNIKEIVPLITTLECSEKMTEQLLNLFFKNDYPEIEGPILKALSTAYSPQVYLLYIHYLEKGPLEKSKVILSLLSQVGQHELIPYLLLSLSQNTELQKEIWLVFGLWGDLPELRDAFGTWLAEQTISKLLTHGDVLSDITSAGLLLLFQNTEKASIEISNFSDEVCLQLESKLKGLLFRPHHTFKELLSLTEWLKYFPEIGEDNNLRMSALKQGVQYMDSLLPEQKKSLSFNVLQLTKTHIAIQKNVLNILFQELNLGAFEPVAPHLLKYIKKHLIQTLEEGAAFDILIPWLNIYYEAEILYPLLTRLQITPNLISDYLPFFMRHEPDILKDLVPFVSKFPEIAWQLLIELSLPERLPLALKCLESLPQEFELETMKESLIKVGPRLNHLLIEYFESKEKTERGIELCLELTPSTELERFEPYFFECLQLPWEKIQTLAASALKKTQKFTLDIIDWGLENQTEVIAKSIISERGIAAFHLIFSSLGHYQYKFKALHFLKPLLIKNKHLSGEFADLLFQYLTSQVQGFRAFILTLLLQSPPQSHILRLIDFLEVATAIETEGVISSIQNNITEELYGPVLVRLLKFEDKNKVKSLFSCIPAEYFEVFIGLNTPESKVIAVLKLLSQLKISLPKTEELLSHSSQEVVYQALKYISHVKLPVNKELHPFLNHPNPDFMALAVEALGQLKDQVLIPLIKIGLSHPKAVVKFAFIRAIGHLGLKEYEQELLYALEQPKKDLEGFEATLDALTQMPVQGAKKQLLEWRKKEWSPTLIQKIYLALSQYGSEFFSRLVTVDFEESESEKGAALLLPFLFNHPETAHFRIQHFLDWPLSLQEKALTFWAPQNTPDELFFLKQLLFQAHWKIQRELLNLMRLYPIKEATGWLPDFEDGLRVDKSLKGWMLIEELKITKSVLNSIVN